jgi:transketolase
MRKAFVQTLIRLARQDDRIILLTGDLGFMALEPFADEFPKRFFNVGVAEQNMLGLASGLAKDGYIPYVYSIAPFCVLRPLEFIRNGPIYHRLPVRIVGIGAGFDYGNNGLTHYGIDDIGSLRCQPGIHIISPCDYQQAETAFLRTWDIPEPVYYRLSKDDTTIVQGLDGRFVLGGAHVLRPPAQVGILALGTMSSDALKISDLLEQQQLSCGVVAVASVSPPPLEDLTEFMCKTGTIFTLENHYITGGLGSLAAEIIAEKKLDCRLVRCGVEALPNGRTGNTESLHIKSGIDPHSMVKRILQELKSAT